MSSSPSSYTKRKPVEPMDEDSSSSYKSSKGAFSPSMYSRRKPVERSDEENSSIYPPDKNKQGDMFFLNQAPRTPSKSPLRGGTSSSQITSSNTQTTIVQPVMSTMNISSTTVDTVSSSRFVGKRPSLDVGSNNSHDRDFISSTEEEIYKSIPKRRPPGPPQSSSPPSHSSSSFENISPPLSPKQKKLPSLSIASDILASSEAMLSQSNSTQRTNPNSILDTTDEMLVQLLISQAVVDSKDFEILSLEEVEELKKDHSLLKNRMGALTNKLATESKIREAASSLARLHASNKRLSRQAGDHLAQSNRKVDQLATDLWKLTQRASDVQRKLLQHMAGVLSVGIRKLEERQYLAMVNPEQLPSTFDNGKNGIDHLFNEIMGVDKTANEELEKKVASLESSFQKANQTLADARMSIKRKDKELEELKSKVDDNVAEAHERTIAELRTELEEVASRLDIVLRKHKAAKRNAASDNEDEGSEDSDGGAPSNRLSTMTTATQHLQKEQYRNISKNMSELEKSLEDYQFRIYKLEQDLNAAKNNADENIQSLQSNLQDASKEKVSLEIQLESEKSKQQQLEVQVIELESKVKNIEDLEEQIKLLEEQKGISKAKGNMREKDLENKLEKKTKEFEAMTGTLKNLFNKLPDTTEQDQKETNFSVDTLITRVHSLYDENAKLLDTVTLLQTQLSRAESSVESLQEQGKLKGVLEATQTELEDIKAKLRELERKAQSDLNAYSERETEMRNEMAELREKLTTAQEKVRKHEAALKRKSVSLEGKSIEHEFQQQLAAQEQEYEAQIKERDSLLTRLRNDLENTITEKKNVAQIVGNLEEMVQSKSRTLDQREVTINRLEDDIVQYKMELAELKTASDGLRGLNRSLSLRNGGRGSGGASVVQTQLDDAHNELSSLREKRKDLESEMKRLKRVLDDAQKKFSAREDALESHSNALQKELDGTLREFERLTRNFLDFNSERQKLEADIDKLSRERERLENELADERIKNIGSDDKELMTTQTLRKEFRQMMSELRAEQAKALQREQEEKKRLESTVRSLRREKEAERWEKASKSTQTKLIASM